VRQTFVRDKWAEKVLDFAGFSSCVPLVFTQKWGFTTFEHQYYVIMTE
jgi:hypothetical protein